MKLFVTSFYMLMSLIIQAQKDYQDEPIGWKKVYNYGADKKGFQFDGKNYSPSQMSIANTILNWMQASYMPIGLLGDAKRSVLQKSTVYSPWIKALPHSYGAVVNAYIFLKKEGNKWINETSHNYYWRIMANGIPNPEYYAISFLSSEKECYFTIPGLQDADADQWRTLQQNTGNHSVIKKYYNKILPDFGGASSASLIIMSKDNVLPFQQLTIGEVLLLTEKSIPAWLETEKKKIAEATQYPANKNMYRDYEFALNKAVEKANKAKGFLTHLETKYKEKLNKPACLFNGRFEMADLANGYDIFSGNESSDISSAYPVYKIKPDLLAKCKTDQPQWITITWGGGTLGDDVRYKHFTESIVNNFNYDHLYQYFFEKEKVRNEEYQPFYINPRL